MSSTGLGRAPLLKVATLWIVIGIGLPVQSAAARSECDLAAYGIVSAAYGLSTDVVAPVDVAHIRKSLADVGFTVGGFYLGETFANTGGFRHGATYDGVLWTYLNGDLYKAGFWKGLCFYADATEIHGRSITADHIGSLVTVSNYEESSTHLSELWLEQHLLNDHLAIRVGQLTAETEFFLSLGGLYFLDDTWEWASLASADLPVSGSFSTPGVRVAIKPNDKSSLMVGVFNGGNPECTGSPQPCDSELSFRFDSPALLMVEGSYSYNQNGRLPGTIKIGGWNDFGTFHDQRFDSAGMPIAISFNSGRPINSDWAFYSIIDQLIWRMPDRKIDKRPKGIALFGRIVGAPANQNLVDFYADGGITFNGIIPNRADDALGIGVAYTGISSEAHGFDVDSGLPVARTYEALLEMCYTAQIKKGWTLQPDFQYIWRPGGGVPEPSGKGTEPNAAVWGVRTIINF
jgi:porin